MSCHALRIILASLGAVCQIGGLAWALAEVTLAREREFDEGGALGRVLRFLFPAKPEPRQTGATIAPYRTDARLSLGEPPNETELQRVARELGNLRAEVGYLSEDVDRRFADLRGDVSDLSETVGGRIARIEQRQGEQRRTSLLREARGAWLFAVGAALSAAAAII